jgi:hypothetical protein
LKKEPNDVSDILREFIWFNRKITVDRHALFDEKLYKAGVKYISDIIKPNGSFFTHTELCNKYKCEIQPMTYMSLIDAIPLNWRLHLKNNKFQPINPDLESVHITLKTISKPVNLTNSKEIYWLLKDQSKVIPPCINKWREKHHFEFTEQQWKYIFNLPSTITQNTKLREFQYKIIHRTYASDSFVSHFDRTVDKNCNHCNKENCAVHCFAECKKVQTIWTRMCTWYNNIFGTKVSLSTREIIFGKLSNTEHCLNFLLLHLKWFIHSCRMKDQAPWFMNFLLYFRYELEQKKYIAVKNNTLGNYNKCFKKIEEALG